MIPMRLRQIGTHFHGMIVSYLEDSFMRRCSIHYSSMMMRFRLVVVMMMKRLLRNTLVFLRMVL